MAHETDLRAEHFIQGSTPRITYTLKDEAGDTITSALTTQVATIYDATSKAAIPGWTDEDIDGLQGNSVVSGVGTWDLPADATAKLTNADVEDHVIAMTATYGTGRVLKHDILIRVHRRPVGS